MLTHIRFMAIAGFELRFSPKETHFPTYISPHDIWEANPCYVYKGVTQHLGKEYTFHSYRWYYAMNPGIGCCFAFPGSRTMGSHEHDMEGVVILFDEHGSPKHVYFQAHGYGQGVWRTWEECEKTENGLLVVYVARYSHASYPNSRVYLRGFGFANDVTCSNGKRLTYTSFMEFPKESSLSNGMSRPLPSHSITPFLRFTIPFSEDRIKKL